MVEQVIEVVQLLSLLVTGILGKRFPVGVIEGLREAAEQFGHRQVGFAQAEMRRWVHQTGLLRVVGEGVTRPQITVNQSRLFVGQVEVLIQLITQSVDFVVSSHGK